MSTNTERQAAIRRARRAAARLAVVPATAEAVASLLAIVEGVRTFDTWEAWDAVVALEWMVTERGLVSPAEIEAEREQQAESHRAEAEALRARFAPAMGEWQ
jgi:uncharacterized lipoprotein YmbA